MEQNVTRAQRILAGLVLGVLTAFFLLVGLRGGTHLLRKRGMDNAFTRLVFFDEQKISARETIECDWASLYPFPEGQSAPPVTAVRDRQPRLERVSEKFNALKKKITKWVATDRLMGYFALTRLAKKYEAILGWNLASTSEYNGVIFLPDGYLTVFVDKRDVTECAQSTARLASFCRDRGIDFLYVNFPHKNCRFEDAEISGVLDFVNQNADDFLAQLAAAGVDHLDLRQILHDEGMPHHGSFFRTDHHWLPETGLWASRHILRVLRDQYGWDVDPSALDADHFTAVTYPRWFLGSQGKKVTLERTEPEDITLLYPKSPTRFHYVVPNLGIDTTGDFSVTYDMSAVETKDYYHNSPYCAYNHHDRPVIKITNEQVSRGKRLLIIHDSFSNCVIPFLAIGIKSIDALDIRYFDGSVQTYIESEKPDMVIILYTAEVIGDSIYWISHGSLFDFR